MGNSQSTEENPSPQGKEPEDSFNLSDIPDDRDLVARRPEATSSRDAATSGVDKMGYAEKTKKSKITNRVNRWADTQDGRKSSSQQSEMTQPHDVVMSGSVDGSKVKKRKKRDKKTNNTHNVRDDLSYTPQQPEIARISHVTEPEVQADHLVAERNQTTRAEKSSAIRADRNFSTHRPSATAVEELVTSGAEFEGSAKKKKKSRVRKRSQRKSSGSTNMMPDNFVSDMRMLKEREPEMFGEYAMSDESDNFDQEQIKPAEPVSLRPLPGSTEPSSFKNRTVEVLGKEKNSEGAFQSPNSDDEVALEARNEEEYEGEAALIRTVDGHILSVESSADAQVDESSESDRFPCPHADKYDCRKRFMSLRSAVRHAKAHDTKFECMVCGRTVGRQDTLLRHEKRHTPQELAKATSNMNSITLKHGTGAEDTRKISSPNESRFTNREQQGKKSNAEFGPSQTALRPVQGQSQTPNLQGTEADSAKLLEAESDAYMSDAPEQNLARESASSESFSDNMVQTEIRKRGEKRRRNVFEAAYAGPEVPPVRSKRRKVTESPPTSLGSAGERTRAKTKQDGVSESLAKVDSDLRRSKPRENSIDRWTQPYELKHGLRHPLRSSGSPQAARTSGLEVLIPIHGARPSSTNSNRPKTYKLPQVNLMEDGETYRQARESLHLATRTGMVESSSEDENIAIPVAKNSLPVKMRQNVQQQESEADDSDLVGMATSVARRTGAGRAKRKKTQTQHTLLSEIELEPEPPTSAFEGEDEYELESQSDADDRVAKSNSYQCSKCHRSFKSKHGLKNHMSDPTVHLYLFECHTCAKEFWCPQALQQHLKESHVSETSTEGKSGHFSDLEQQKLSNWRDRFCDEHSLTTAEFHEMMTTTLRRNTMWTYAFISQKEFMEEYFDVLPNRTRRSMRRYRERMFQNIDTSTEWAPEEDEELVRLHKELGPKWVEIGKRLMRSSDAARVRWKNKLQHSGNTETGEWSLEEDRLFAEAIDAIVADSSMTPDEDTEARITWSEVSKRVKTRTARQCSNHWRAMHSFKKNGIWVRPAGFGQVPGKSPLITPSKMARRVTGSLDSTKKRSRLSDMHVKDSDDEADTSVKDGIQKLNDNQRQVPEDVISTPEGEDEGTYKKKSARCAPTIDKTSKGTLTASQSLAQRRANASVNRSSNKSKKSLSRASVSSELPVRQYRGTSTLLGTDDEELSAIDEEEDEGLNGEGEDVLDPAADVTSSDGDTELSDDGDGAESGVQANGKANQSVDVNEVEFSAADETSSDGEDSLKRDKCEAEKSHSNTSDSDNFDEEFGAHSRRAATVVDDEPEEGTESSSEDEGSFAESTSSSGSTSSEEEDQAEDSSSESVSEDDDDALDSMVKAAKQDYFMNNVNDYVSTRKEKLLRLKRKKLVDSDSD